MHTELANIKCLKCGNSHYMWNCPDFRALTLDGKWEFVRAKRLCRCCISSADHHQRNCPRKKSCGVSGCTANHNRILHFTEEASEEKNSSEEPP